MGGESLNFPECFGANIIGFISKFSQENYLSPTVLKTLALLNPSLKCLRLHNLEAGGLRQARRPGGGPINLLRKLFTEGKL